MRAPDPSEVRIPPCERGIFVQWGGDPIVTSGGRGDTSRMDRALNESVPYGGYVIDVEAVASAMLAREPIRRVVSGMLISAEALDGAAICILEKDPAAIGDAA